MILIDTSVLVALEVEKDTNHDSAVRLMARITDGEFGPGVVTDYVFDETLTVTMVRSHSVRKAVLAGQKILQAFGVSRLSNEAFDTAWQIFQKQEGTRALSFTDCSLLSVASLDRIRYVATFDRGFRKEKSVKVVDGAK